MHQKVAIIILNWNNWQDTIECLESLYQLEYPCFEVIVVDNASQDGSIERIDDYCNARIAPNSKFFEYSNKNKPIIVRKYTKNELHTGTKSDEQEDRLRSNRELTIILNEQNYGFAEGSNIGIRFAMINDASYVMLLNNDTVVAPDSLGELIEQAQVDPVYGFIGPKVYFYDCGGRNDVINSVGGHLIIKKGATHQIGFGEVDRGQFDVPMEVDYVEGSCLLTRAEVIRDIGLLDSAYFTYWEETDWCTRGRNAGYKAMYAPKSKIWHKVAASNIGLKNEYYRTRNTFWFLKKHASREQYISFILYFFLFRIYFFTIFLLLNGDLQKLTYFFKGVFDGIRMTQNKPACADQVE